MSKIGKISLLIAGLFLAGAGVTSLVLNGWHPSLFVPVGIAVVFVGIAIANDHRIYRDFFSMRTTKHGMNMGTLILLTFICLGLVNFIAARNDKKFDWTKEKLNSLSDQSIKAASAVKDELQVIMLYNRDQADPGGRDFTESLIGKYHDVNKKIVLVQYNARQHPDLAQKYGFTGGEFGLFLEYHGKNIKVNGEINEESVTRALLSLDRQSQKIVYLTMGHGEKRIDNQEAAGLSQFKSDLDTSYEVRELNLLDNKIPEDAALVAIIGPTQQLLENEMKTLRDYARRGGHLFIAADPGQQSNLAQLTKTLGIELKNNFILDQRASIPGMGPVAALGTQFSTVSSITKEVPRSSYSVMVLTMAMSKAPDAPQTLRFDEIVRTDEKAVSTNKLTAEVHPDGQGPFTIGMTVEGKLPDSTGTSDFSAVVFGDSDFMSNALYRQNLNRDLAVNSFSYLAQDTNLISIRPKYPPGTVLTLSREKLLIIVLCFLIPLPLLMFGAGGFIWYRRRSA